jgi:hydroxymethylglutaryl-CoA reductase (NADPH)
MNDYPIIPGRGLVTINSTKERLIYLNGLDINTVQIQNSNLTLSHITKNIESYIGSIEIPVGLVGPLRYNTQNSHEMVYSAAATLEGALIASMNRGAKAVSLSGGFSANVVHQKMVRCPMFIFSNENECQLFNEWIKQHENDLKHEAEKHSNHAKLIDISPVVTGNSVHIYFIFNTADASGQNMTTTCTWHAILLAKELFYQQYAIEPIHFVIEGNGASDKKVSVGNITRGRGINVTAEVELNEKVIESVLRTTSNQMLLCYESSLKIAQLEGMVGYNINVSNTIASIFAATGQDLGSLYESSTGILKLSKTGNGLKFHLTLPNLVIGTIGGGTHLPKQKETLEMMNCFGSGKVNRFAEIIAGFALSLETSTFAAIVSGQFAKAHEKLGRNKPVNWLTKAELNLPFVQKCLKQSLPKLELIDIQISQKSLCENGIIISLTNRINRKLTGFIPLEISLKEGDNLRKELVLIKSKPLDQEVIQGLHLMATAVNPDLATLIYKHHATLEFKNCHKKELLANTLLQELAFDYAPTLWGTYIDEKREIYLLFTEFLNPEEMTVFNSENKPELWNESKIRGVIDAITRVHKHFENKSIPDEIAIFEPWNASELYLKMAEIINKEYLDGILAANTKKIAQFASNLKHEHDKLIITKTLIHNDLNSRNAGIRADGRACIYDWELTVKHFPHRDIIELLSFTLNPDFSENDLFALINYHTELHQPDDEKMWYNGYIYCLKEYVVTRLSFYLTGRIVLDYAFTEYIVNNAFKMIEILENKVK